MTTEPGLYMVAVPIGNPLDLTSRAKFVLESADIIAAEDTRKAADLFRRAGIIRKSESRLFSTHSHNESASAAGLIAQIQAGSVMAYVSDAGTPRVSDPGGRLVAAAWQAGVRVVPVPGVSAVMALVSVAPIPVEPLLFLGFLSPKSSRRMAELQKYSGFEGTLAVYESVHRITAFLEDAMQVFGDIPVVIGRELTKTWEEVYCGTLAQAILWSAGRKGEFTLLLSRQSKKG